MTDRSDQPEGTDAEFRLDRRAFSVTSLDEQDDDGVYWATRPLAERMAALEHLRRMAYGDAALASLKRVLSVVDLHTPEPT
ncbi:MAG: hypothetical protein ACKVZJ_03860 [Phycisphaerales bacterium]